MIVTACSGEPDMEEGIARQPMKTVIIGGGKAARSILELIYSKKLSAFPLEILCVVDPNLSAPGAQYAEEHWWPTLDTVEEAVQLPGLELVVELTGDESVVSKLYRLVPEGVRVMDHTIARIFFEIYEYDRALHREYKRRTSLQERIEKDRRQLQMVLDSLPDVVMVVNRDMRIEWANRQFAKVSGIDPEDARQMLCFEAFCKNPDRADEKDEGCPCRKVMKTGEPVVTVAEKREDDLTTRYYQITANPIFDEKGKVAQVVETSREITTLMRLKRESEESQWLFRNLIEAATDFISIKDIDGQYRVINPAAAKFFGKSVADFMGRTDHDVLPEAAAKTLTAADAQVLEIESDLCSTDTVEINGKTSTMLVTRFPLRNYSRKVIGVCSIARDVTQERRLQDQLRRADRLAAVGKAVGGLAHDIKNILNGFRGAQYVLNYGLETEDMDEIKKGGRIVERNIERIAAMIQNMLAFSKDRKPTLALTDPCDLVREVCESISPTLAETDINLECSTDNAGRKFRMDSTMIHRVVMNLVSNSIDACNEKGYADDEMPLVSIRAGYANDNTYTITISDNGIGMTDKVKSHLFQEFFSTKGSRGTGFGMPVSQKLIEEMDGRMRVESEFGKGTSIHITLPVKS